MADQTPETKEEREARWWRDWWAADYSWDGLAKKEILRGGPWGEKTLQDYWRRDPETNARRTDAALKTTGELIEFDGRWWHQVHLPPKARVDEQTSWKAEPGDDHWTRLSTLVSARLALAKFTPGGFGAVKTPPGFAYIPSGPDRRARFDGVVALTLPQPPASPPDGEGELLHLSCDQAAFLANLDCEGVGFGPGTTFYGAIFSGFARFARATFSGKTGFHDTTFLEDAGFEGAIFSDYAGFDRANFRASAGFQSAILSGDARFGSATFSGNASFHSATFSGNADFNSASFSGAALFDSANFSGFARFHSGTFSGRASFANATFSGEADFVGATFLAIAYFGNATFLEDAAFNGVTFSGNIGFKSATFKRGASFCIATFSERARFDRTRFSGRADFDGATLSGKADFLRARFSGEACFDDATFSGDASFHRAIFRRDAGFHSATISGEAGFDSARFSGEARFHSAIFLGGVRFQGAIFRRDVDFHSATFSGDVGFHCAIFRRDAGFQSAKFSGEAGFQGARFSETARFDGATFLGAGGFDSTTFSGDVGFVGSRFAKAATFSGRFERRGSFRDTVFERHVTFSARVDQPELGFAGAFYGARFADIANFSESGPPRPGTADRNDGARMAIAFDEALIEKTLILTDGSDAEAERAFQAAVATIRAQAPDCREELLRHLEDGCRITKIAKGKARDEVREQRYYSFQLRTRHMRRDTPCSEKLLGYVYGAVSVYGGSLVCPLVWLGILIFLSAGLYWLLASALSGDTSFTPFSWDAWGHVWSAFDFSFSRSLFFSAWPGVPEEVEGSWRHLFLNGHGAGWSLAIRGLSAIQSIASGVLIFLFALAVRRRFQIGG